jgi:hypothetical protein
MKCGFLCIRRDALCVTPFPVLRIHARRLISGQN